jgi:adenine-specific DNA-methyltransferase
LRLLATVGAQGGDNLLIHGDNGDVMGALLRGGELTSSLRGQVKLCYLDPPFNTGSRFGHYDDSLDSAGWLEVLRQRLVRVGELLSLDGSVWLHLDDREQHHGRCLLDEVFGRGAFVSTIVWQKRSSRDNRTAFSSAHDYLHVYAPAGAKRWKSVRNGLPDTGAFANPDGDPRGPWRSVPLSAQAGHGTAGQFYSVVSPAGVVHPPPPGRCWTYTRGRFAELVEAGRVYWPRQGEGRPRLKRYAAEVTDLAPSTLWLAEDVGENAVAKKELLRLFPGEDVFDTPKPERLLERVIHIGSNPGDLVLDCYLGSGTTAAVAHKTGRRWVGIEAAGHTVRRIALPRLRRVVEGDDDGGVTSTAGWGGGGGFRLLAATS